MQRPHRLRGRRIVEADGCPACQSLFFGVETGSSRVQRIIDKALEKDRDVRCQSAAELRADLKRLKRDTESARQAGNKASASSIKKFVQIFVRISKQTAVAHPLNPINRPPEMEIITNCMENSLKHRFPA